MNIADILTEERVVLDADLETKQAVLEALAAVMSRASSQLDSQSVLNSLLVRERLGTTGVGAGVAIPHGRTAHTTAVGAFLRTRRPIPYDAADKAPVDLFFGLCVPAGAITDHLALLAALASIFNEPGLVGALRSSTSVSAAYAVLHGASTKTRAAVGRER